MAYVLLALLLFCSSVMTHVFFCRRTKIPGLHTKVFVRIAIIFLGIYAAGAYFTGQGNIFSEDSFWGLPFKITAGVIFVLLVPVYMIFYVLTQLMSPSKKILLTIARCGSLSYAEVLLSVQEEDFIGKRLCDLCASGCVREIQGRFVLSTSGQKIAGFLRIMQSVLGREMGG